MMHAPPYSSQSECPRPTPARIPVSRRSGPIRMEHTFQHIPQEDITDEMLRDAARLFTNNYGTWGPGSATPGRRVKLNAKRLREQYLPENGQCWYVKATFNGKLIGNLFTSRWTWEGKKVCWVTQLVVCEEHRGKGIATMLLRYAMAGSDDVYGIMSSHPYACIAAAATFGTAIENVSMEFIRASSQSIMKESPIQYIKDAAVCGTLFDANDVSGLISGVDTGFFVDHEEPLQALQQVQDDRNWPLGNLPNGHEFLLLVRAKPRRSISPNS
ncbi:hypothetical protein FOVG_01397 [Fusarium oxysporum f. sp. pisi HDV247]|uniref:N-acetyltransferase domain-containing protein n=1 Tax=Fusarium oxysporum f. sp. pisi HDV247 TaxID=1080344 RepID=W9QH01_FUSOX|nr:hypothetical protein FOVG_01397 [Fusarium oxysporum f. sp. pisi HDV247]